MQTVLFFMFFSALPLSFIFMGMVRPMCLPIKVRIYNNLLPPYLLRLFCSLIKQCTRWPREHQPPIFLVLYSGRAFNLECIFEYGMFTPLHIL